MEATAALLPCGTRLHLQHGPIDLVIGADGQRDRAFEAAFARFQTILRDLMGELEALRQPFAAHLPLPAGAVAKRMHVAAMSFVDYGFLTRMAAVAGSVADMVLDEMTQAADLRRAYVNNGGDIALHLHAGETYSAAMAGHDGGALGQISLSAADGAGGIATSGRHGRSLSLGIADSVTVLARNAATADVAATLIANAVDLPDHCAVTRRPANAVVDDSDLGARLVVVGCGPLCAPDRAAALQAGLEVARRMVDQNTIHAAALFLQGAAVATDTHMIASPIRTQEYA